MDSMNVTNARQKLYQIILETKESHRPLKITGKNANAVLISEEDWNAIAETLYLNSIPGLADSIRNAAVEPLEMGTAAEDLDWDV